MASKSLWAIVGYLRVNQTITPRQVQALLGCDSKKAHNAQASLITRYSSCCLAESRTSSGQNQPRGLHQQNQLRLLHQQQKQSRQQKQPKHQQRRPSRTYAVRTGRATKFIKFLGVHGHE